MLVCISSYTLPADVQMSCTVESNGQPVDLVVDLDLE